ncbi:sugar transferase [Spirochaeta thermophila DSM 6578]|uniref:Sugar transferase n=1 Tax=Winmispira thermophila (strain ATCC 700085 / DSM 6578 / Z-1203) TaxID=869211 RepID=G0GAY3_WINT7|nr:glycosyltransferase [Spirochaeta thermophila]AEJ61879.1 sugar transferase [Spirochaeta thermophila DSM 6578]
MKRMTPVVMFVYNRPYHTQQTLFSICENEGIEDSVLYIFSDGPRTSNDEVKVNKVRELLKKAKGFKEIIIIKREENWGLARNIIDGVTSVINEHGRVVVLEDDLVTSPYFLHFMKATLERYEDEPKVWHISGWNYPIDTTGMEDAFFWRVMNCWGWGTWADRWTYYKKDPQQLITLFSKKDIRKFNLDGVENFWRQVLDNFHGKLDTWAIFWYATIFQHQGLCLNPSVSYVKNIGLDGSGMHCGHTHWFDTSLNMKKEIDFPSMIEENSLAVARIKRFYRQRRGSLFLQIVRKVKWAYSEIKDR